MIYLNHPQGSGDWAKARLGIPTSSKFDKIITPKTRKFSESSMDYMCDLLVEQMFGAAVDGASTAFMQRGEIQEANAIGFYQMQKDMDTEPGGVVLLDSRRAGCSPDRIVGIDGLVEIKCPSASKHVRYALESDGIGYRCQVQGQLWISEREWVDTISYHPLMLTEIVRQYRDEEFIKALAAAVHRFNEMMDDAKARLIKRGYQFQNPDIPALKVA